MSNLQNHYHFKLDFQNVDQHKETSVIPQISDRLPVQFLRQVSLSDHSIPRLFKPDQLPSCVRIFTDLW